MQTIKNVICKQCGTVNHVSVDVATNGLDQLLCALPTGFEWVLPSGKIQPIHGPALYADSTGIQMTREAYIAKYNLDPEIALEKMRATLSPRLKKVVKLGGR
jgi:hypothetical protein